MRKFLGNLSDLMAQLTILSRFKALALNEVSHVQGFMRLLMKPRNGQRWSAEDKVALRGHLRHLARTLPAFGVFALPGGSLLLPLLAMFLDRRKSRNRSIANPRPVEGAYAGQTLVKPEAG